MTPGKASRTAMAAAAARAGHLHGHAGVAIHADDFAHRLIGVPDPAQLVAAMAQWDTPSPPRVCAFFALRHRYSEDRLQEAITRGVRQIVLLGAGLDSLALRRPTLAREVLLVEVDHPDSQRWKRARLEELGLTTPSVVYVPVDFGCDHLVPRLEEAGVRLDRPIFFSWLGVTQYISRDAVDATLRLVAGRPADSELVFDVIVRDDLLSPAERAFSDAASAQSAEMGEPWVTYFDPPALEDHLAALGFSTVERLTPEIAASRYYAGQPAGVTPLEAWQVMSARV